MAIKVIDSRSNFIIDDTYVTREERYFQQWKNMPQDLRAIAIESLPEQCRGLGKSPDELCIVVRDE